MNPYPPSPETHVTMVVDGAMVSINIETGEFIAAASSWYGIGKLTGMYLVARERCEQALAIRKGADALNTPGVA